jgi:hypothetical protein
LQYFREWLITTLIYSALMVPVYNYFERKKAAKKTADLHMLSAR